MNRPGIAAFFSSGASSVAPRVDALFWSLVLASAVVVAVLVLLNLTFLIRYRRGSPARRGPLEVSTWKFEATWIGLTTVGFLGFFFWGARVYLDMERVPADAYSINVVGRQWMWDIRHPNGRREFDELHVPLGRDVRLLLSSEDVIHSFFAPEFRVKQDAVPGKTVSVWFKPTREGVYPLFCTQYCGTKHSQMTGRIVVMSPDAYAAWLTSGPTPRIAERGRELFTKYSCSGCHDQPSQIHAPPLLNVYGSMVPLQDGTFVYAGDEYLRDSILLPTKQVVAGYQPIMPSFQGVVSESDLLDLIAYLKSLPTAASAAPQPSPTAP